MFVCYLACRRKQGWAQGSGVWLIYLRYPEILQASELVVTQSLMKSEA